MRGLQRTVLCLAVAVFLIWAIFHFGMIAGDENGKARFFLGILFALMILVRQKEKSLTFFLPRWTTPFTALTGTALSLTGIIFNVGQFEWLGLILLVFSAFHWALSKEYSRDVLLSFFVLYWIHPLPGNLFSQIQIAMQVLSVEAAEWFLHCFNVRVWAEGAVLNTGFQTFPVPESCSGTMTAVTVLLTALGIGIFMRLRWFETIALLVIGTVQVFLLNILYVSFMVIWSTRMPREWAGTFLHDTRGCLLLAAILLVLIEAVFLKKWTTSQTVHMKKIKTGEIEEPEKATILPIFWRIMNRWTWVGLVILVLSLGVAFAVYKKRPGHRALMISDVIDGLMEHDPAKAERAVNEALRLKPGDKSLISKHIYVMVLRGKFNEALIELNSLSGSLSTTETVMKSSALMSLNKTDEAVALIESLPEAEKRLPSVAIIRAEYAARTDKPAVVASNVVLASTSLLLINRVRGLFPYLGTHKQWRAIMDSDRENVPYRECTHALIAVYASLELNDIFRASKALKAGLTAWPNDPRFLGGLFMLATKRPGSEWEDFFANSIKTNVRNLEADRLASYIEYCFKLSRPDLAWLLYLKLREVDPQDPALFLIPAQFGGVWFSFRCHELGIEAGSKRLKIDLKPFSVHTKNMEPFKSFWERVPLIEELSANSADKKRTEYLNLYLAEMERRKKSGKINRRMHMTYPAALFMAGRYTEAEAVLDELEQKYPDAGKELLFQRAVFYNQQGRWQDSYEILMKYRNLSTGGDNLNADIMLINAMLNLNLGICAMEVAERAREAFPDSNLALMTVASIWNVFYFKDQALFLLGRNGEQDWNYAAIAQLLYETGCYNEAEKLSRSIGIDIVRTPALEKQGIFPLPAEATIVRRWPVVFSPAEMDREAERLEKESSQAVSQYIRKLRLVTAEWYRGRGQGDISSSEKWLATGRDNIEKAGAMYQLAMLLARQKQYAQAEKAIEDAIVLMPRSAMLWRVLVSLTEGNADVIRRARLSCPSDPELWLASLVVMVGKQGGGKWLIDEMGKAAAGREFAPGTMVRAGDFLLRQRFVEPASLAARSAIERCRGSISAYVLGLRCALTTRDKKWALSCALKGIECSRDPSPFYKLLVGIKTIDKVTDTDMVAALEYLEKRFPKETQWAEMLGEAYFQKSNVKRALDVLDKVMVGSLKGVKLRTLLLVAEAARLEDDYAKAIRIMEYAYGMYPDTLSVLNNLVYNLVRNGDNPGNIARARELLPKLIDIGGRSAAVLDTVAMVYMKTGDMVQARKYSEKARELVGKNDYATLEIDFNAAEIMFRLGNVKDAKTILETIRREPEKSQFVDYGIKELLKRIEKETGRR